MYEDDFILNAARINLSEENIDALKKISKDKIDWIVFERKACIHGVDTFIYYSLKNYHLSDLIPVDIFKNFQENYYRNAIHNTIFIEGVDILSTIIQDKIIFLKGAYLIKYLYPNIAIRSMCDIDILLEKDKVKENWNKLVNNGFSDNDIVSKSAIHERCGSHLIPLHTNKFTTEVHWNLFGGNRFSKITETAWLTSYQINGNLYALSNEMLLIHLCIHFYKHLRRCAILRMVCDINELILKHIDMLDWNKINSICSNSVLRNELTTALTYAYILFETPVPANLINKKVLNGTKIDLTFLLSGNHKSNLRIILSSISSFNQSADKIGYVFRTFFPLKKWIKNKYGEKSDFDLLITYFKYWSLLFQKHILNRNIQI